MTAVYAELGSCSNYSKGPADWLPNWRPNPQPVLKAPADEHEKLPDATSSWQIASAVGSGDLIASEDGSQFWRITPLSANIEIAFGTAAELASPPTNGQLGLSGQDFERSAVSGQTFAYRLAP